MIINLDAVTIGYAREFFAQTRQLRNREIMAGWVARGVDATTGGQWAARGFLPGETDAMRAQGVTPDQFAAVDAAQTADRFGLKGPQRIAAETGVPVTQVRAIMADATNLH